jgi:hypothetical protein
MRSILFTLLFISVNISVNGQSSLTWDEDCKCARDANGNIAPTTILTAMPFLRIAPDARGGAMGDAGLVFDPSASSMHYNPSNLVFSSDDSGLSLNFTPWLRSLQVQDIYLTYIAGFKKLDEYQTIGAHLKYFSLGTIILTDIFGTEFGQSKPREFEIGAAYARKLGDNLSASVAPKFLYSNLAAGVIVNGVQINAATSFAADISFTYRKKTSLGGYRGVWALGGSISNIGAKVSYTDNVDRDFLPTNLGIGTMVKLDFDDYNQLSVGLDLNKLLVPSPHSYVNPDYNLDGDQIPDYRQKSLFDGIFGSFSDAQSGFNEELKEINYSLGLEYLYDKQFAVRAGYFYENDLKGARQFFSMGAGIKYNIFEFNLSYLTSTSFLNSPLNNTFRFGVNFNISDFNSGTEEVEEIE